MFQRKIRHGSLCQGDMTQHESQNHWAAETDSHFQSIFIIASRSYPEDPAQICSCFWRELRKLKARFAMLQLHRQLRRHVGSNPRPLSLERFRFKHKFGYGSLQRLSTKTSPRRALNLLPPFHMMDLSCVRKFSSSSTSNLLLSSPEMLELGHAASPTCMLNGNQKISIFPTSLGDSCVLMRFGTGIDEQANQVKQPRGLHLITPLLKHF